MGSWAEAELGEIGGKDGVHSPTARTDPADAAGYVAATGVDALAVAVGSSHAMLTRDAVLDLGLIAALRAAVPVPLVLHGSSGVPDEGLAAAAAAGMTKINVATQLNKVFTGGGAERAGGRYGGGGPAAVHFGRAGRDRRGGDPAAAGHRGGRARGRGSGRGRGRRAGPVTGR